MPLDTPVHKFPAVRDKVSAGFERIGIRTVRDLLFHFPSRYEDRRNIVRIKDIVVGQQATFRGTITDITATTQFRRNRGRGARRMAITEASIKDETGELHVTWFNQPYLAQQYKVDTVVYLMGAPSAGKKGVILVAPEIERVTDGKDLVHAGRIVPIYPETEGVTSRMIRYLVHRSLSETKNLREYLPESMRSRENLADIADAIRMIHFPVDDLELSAARERLAFDELLIPQLASLVMRKQRTTECAPLIQNDARVTKNVMSSLPFTLTKSQRKTIVDIYTDMEKPYPMNRLLAGDVGSGKTVVAGFAALAAKTSGFQTALIAPTEILARQHAATLSELLGSEIKIGLLTGTLSPASRRDILLRLADNKVDVIIGTHALFSDDITFHQIGLVVVDEQHRFGVLQRGKLGMRTVRKKIPHFLSLTATPIPRTLQLTAYGDIDVSLLDSRPGQQKITTTVVSSDERNTMYASLANRIRDGQQVFVVCPRVEERDDEVKSVEQEFKRLSADVFSDMRVEMLHGKMESEKKQHVLHEFSQGSIDVLVASSVIEVGVDIAGASALLVEGAERFGLAQLHQLRGRVGRRGQEAICYLSATDDLKESVERLRILEHSSDGLKIAEADLARRGAGEIYGTKQSGTVRLKIANITDIPFVLRVRNAANILIEEDPSLVHAPILKRRVQQLTATPRFA